MKAMYDLSQLKLIVNKQALDKQLKHSVSSFGKADAVFEHLSCILQLLKNHKDSTDFQADLYYSCFRPNCIKI